jgi:hypothetical protein
MLLSSAYKCYEIHKQLCLLRQLQVVLSYNMLLLIFGAAWLEGASGAGRLEVSNVGRIFQTKN